MLCVLTQDAAEVESESKERQRKETAMRAKTMKKISIIKTKSYFFENSLHKIDQGKGRHNIRNEKDNTTIHRENTIYTFSKIYLKTR